MLQGEETVMGVSAPARTRGWLVSAGGIAWLAGVFVLQLTYDASAETLPVGFLALALFAGMSAGWGIWEMALSLDNRLAQVGARLVGLSTALFGIGFGLDLFPFETSIGFLLAYSFGLFVLPLGYLLLGIGTLRSDVFPGWAKWVPWAVAATATITYGFHSFAREVWDPPDAVWFVAVGIGWFFLGLASTRIQETAAVVDRS